VIDEGTVENVYRIQIMNRTEAPQTYRISASGIDGLQMLAAPVKAGPAAVASVSVNLRLPYVAAQALQGKTVPVLFEITTEQERRAPAVSSAGQFEKSTFFVPR
jgi:polyferredoxin